LVLHLTVALPALACGAALVADPSGGSVRLDPALLAHSPFPDYRVPGLILAGAVGGTAAWAALTPRARGGVPALVAGATLLGWVIGEILLIRTFHVLQPFCLAVAAGQVASGLAALRRGRTRSAAASAGPVAAFLEHRRIALIGFSADPKDFSRTVDGAFRARRGARAPSNQRTGRPGHPAGGTFLRPRRPSATTPSPKTPGSGAPQPRG
jgi:hypothetical protein